MKTSGKGVQSVDSSQGEDPLISLVAAAPGSGTMPWNEDRSPSKSQDFPVSYASKKTKSFAFMYRNL